MSLTTRGHATEARAARVVRFTPVTAAVDTKSRPSLTLTAHVERLTEKRYYYAFHCAGGHDGDNGRYIPDGPMAFPRRYRYVGQCLGPPCRRSVPRNVVWFHESAETNAVGVSASVLVARFVSRRRLQTRFLDYAYKGLNIIVTGPVHSQLDGWVEDEGRGVRRGRRMGRGPNPSFLRNCLESSVVNSQQRVNGVNGAQLLC